MARMKAPIRIELDDVTRTVLEGVANARALPYRDVNWVTTEPEVFSLSSTLSWMWTSDDWTHLPS